MQNSLLLTHIILFKPIIEWSTQYANSLYSSFFIPFLLAGLLLLIAMIGCIYLILLYIPIRKTQTFTSQLQKTIHLKFIPNSRSK